MARRVNSKFLIIFSAIVLVGVGSAFLIAGPLRNMFSGDQAKKLIAQGDALVKEAEAPDATNAIKKEKLESAARCYQQAAGKDAKNPETFIKLGDVLTKLSQYDVNLYIEGSRKAWDKALEIDPAYLPALRRLADSYHQETLVNPLAVFFSRLEDKASTIHKLDPSDLKAYSRLLIAPLHQWLARIETPSNRIDTSIAELQGLIEKHPDSKEIGDMVFFAAAATARKGFEAKRAQQETQGKELIKQAREMFQRAIKANDKDANLHYRYFELMNEIIRQDAEQEATFKYRETQKAALERARQLATPEDGQLYVRVNIAAHQLEISRRNVRAAEQILLDLQAARPKDQRVRLALARFWRSANDVKRLNEAIELLSLPIEDSGFEGVEAKQKIELEVQTWTELATMYVERYRTLPEAEQAAEMKRIEATYDKIYSRVHDRSFALKLRGRIEVLRPGQDAQVKAIQTFEKAQAQYRIERQGDEDLDITLELAKAYFQTGQTGQAKQQLLKHNKAFPDYIPVRHLLAQTFLRENDVRNAREHVDFLERQAPDAPEVLRLVLAVLNPQTEALKVKATYEKLPENTRPERLIKAQIAALQPVNDLADSTRLFKLVLQADAADFDALQGLRDVLVRQNKKDEALAALRAGLAAKPDDRRIKLLADSLQGDKTPEQMMSDSKELIAASVTDPLQRALKMYEFEMMTARNDPAKLAKAFEHLQAAEKVRPDDGRVLDLMFQHHVTQRDWAKAAWYVERCAEKNLDQAGGLIYRFRLAMAKGTPEDIKLANQHASDLTSKMGEFARSWVFRGQALQAARMYDEAIREGYSLALDKQPENPEALAGIIACYYQLNKPADALRYIEKAREAHPNNPYFNEQWRAAKLQQNPSEVIKPVLAERDANPKDKNKWLALGRAQYAAARKAQGEDAKKYANEAKQTFTEALKQFPDERLIWAFLSEIAQFNNDHAAAEAVLKEMGGRPEFKDTPEPLMMLADLYVGLKKPDAAIATMEQAIAKFKDNTDLRRKLAAFHTQNGRYDAALKLLDPSSADALVRQQVVEIYMLAGSKEGPQSQKFADAEKLLRGLLTTQPRDAQLHALLGVVLLNMSREQQAMESLNTALSIDPANQAALYSRGQMRLKAKTPQLDEAIKDLAALRDANENHVEARVSLAEALRLKGQVEAAERELEQALQRAPQRRDIRMTLAGLYAGAKPPSWADAERVVKDAQQFEPTEPLWMRMLSKMYSVRGLHEKAALQIREAIMQDAKNAATIPGYQKNGELVKEYFDVLEAAKMWSQLETETNGLLATDQNVAQKAWWVYVKRAVAQRNQGKMQESMADFEKAMTIAQTGAEPNQDVLIAIIEKIKDNLGLNQAIARVSLLAGKTTDAQQQARWKVVLAYLYFQNNEKVKATQTIQEAVAQASSLDDRHQVSALNVAGTIYMMSGDQYDQARTTYEQLLAKRADELSALNNIALIHAEHAKPTNLPKALEYAQRAQDVMAKKGVQDPNILDTVGWVNVLAGGPNVDKGIDLLNASIKAGEIPEAYLHLGEAYLVKGMADAAKRNFEYASELRLRKIENKEPVDESLKKKIEDAMIKAEAAQKVGASR